MVRFARPRVMKSEELAVEFASRAFAGESSTKRISRSESRRLQLLRVCTQTLLARRSIPGGEFAAGSHHSGRDPRTAIRLARKHVGRAGGRILGPGHLPDVDPHLRRQAHGSFRNKHRAISLNFGRICPPIPSLLRSRRSCTEAGQKCEIRPG